MLFHRHHQDHYNSVDFALFSTGLHHKQESRGEKEVTIFIKNVGVTQCALWRVVFSSQSAG